MPRAAFNTPYFQLSWPLRFTVFFAENGESFSPLLTLQIPPMASFRVSFSVLMPADTLQPRHFFEGHYLFSHMLR
jgi:hypothetical protein